MKKYLAIIGAFIIASSSVSCSKNIIPAAETEHVAEKLTNAAYKREKRDLPADLKKAYFAAPCDSGYFILGYTDDSLVFKAADKGLTEFSDIAIPDFDIGAGYSICLEKDGTIVTLTDTCDMDEEGNIAEDSEFAYVIRTFSPDGTLLTSAELDEKYPVEADINPGIGSIASDGRYMVAELNGSWEVFDASGKYYGELFRDASRIDAVGNDRDGRVICAVKTEDKKLKLRTLGEDGKLEESSVVYDMDGVSVQAVMPGNGGYKAFIVTMAAVYGVADDDSITPILGTQAASVKAAELKAFIAETDGSFTVLTNSFEKGASLRRIIPADPSELENIPVLKIGMCGWGDSDYWLQEIIDPWNEDDNPFKVELKYYLRSYGDEISTAFDDIAKDSISGDLPDVLFLTDNGYFGNVNMVEKGAVDDLYTYIDSDSRFSRESFVPNILNLLEYNGELPAIATNFDVMAGRVAKTKLVGTEEMTLERRLELTMNPPIEPFENYVDNKDERTEGGGMGLLNWQSWVDFDKGTCDFNSDTFIRFLKYCNEAEGREEKVEYDPENYTAPDMEDEAQRKEQEEKQRKRDLAFREDKLLTAYVSYFDFRTYAIKMRGEIGGEKELTYIDTPTLRWTGTGKMAIYKNSDKKDMAWEYISSFFTDSGYDAPVRDSEFPVINSVFEKFADEQLNGEYNNAHMKDIPGFEDYEGLIWDVGGLDRTQFQKIGKLTEEDVQEVRDFIANMKPWCEQDRFIGSEFNDMAEEEMDRYFSGGCTAEECAEVMQNRLSTYLSERAW